MKWERQGAGGPRALLHAGERNFYDCLDAYRFIDKKQFKEMLDTQLSIISFDYFPDEDFKNRMMALRDQVLSLDEGYTLETVEQIHGRRFDEIFPEILGTKVRYHLEQAYKDNSRTDWKNETR
jgi:hypothetical protein